MCSKKVPLRAQITCKLQLNFFVDAIDIISAQRIHVTNYMVVVRSLSITILFHYYFAKYGEVDENFLIVASA